MVAITSPNGENGCSDLESCGCGSASCATDSTEVKFGDRRLDPAQLAVRAAAFWLLLEEGRPVEIDSVAAHAGVDLATTSKVLVEFASRGNARLAGDRLMGIAGLSAEPTRHQIDVPMGRRWAWCALDAVGIVGAVGEGTIRSETADGRVELHVQHGELEPSELASFVPDGSGMTSSVDQWCPLVNFFPTFEAATAWAEQSGLPGRPVALSTIAARLVDGWRPILNHRPLG